MGNQPRSSRREFLALTGAVAAAGAIGLSDERASAASPATRSRWGPPSPTPHRPNILFLLVDEMRYPPVYEGLPLKRFRRRYLRTQNALRATGVEFHRHYAASTACSPSRTSIFTGHYPSLHGVSQTAGAAKANDDPDMFWLDPNTVPTLGDYFRAGGYRTFYRGKWHVSNADLEIIGTHNQYLSYDPTTGAPDRQRQLVYAEAERLEDYGFEGWIGPEPHGSNPLNSGSSAPPGSRSRDIGFAEQSVELLQRLDSSGDDTPWFMVSSFVNPHDIALWGYAARASGTFDFDVQQIVPQFPGLFDLRMFGQSLEDDLSLKPSCQLDYQQTYRTWMQGTPPDQYFRLYYQLHKNVDDDMYLVYEQLRRTRFFDDTIVVFSSDHGDLLGAHDYLHQKWYQAYDESLRVPLIISNPRLVPAPVGVQGITSHVDLLPTMLGLAGLDPGDLLDEVAVGHTDAVLPVGRNLVDVLGGGFDALDEPIYFMTDDDPSRGWNQQNIFGVGYQSVTQPNHVESVIVEIDGEVWKYSHYFDNTQFWSDTSPTNGPIRDIVVTVDDGPIDVPGTHDVPATKTVKFDPAHQQFEMYNVTADPMELANLAGAAAYAAMEARLAVLLNQQRAAKRLYTTNGVTPGQPVFPS
jgi:choline-sulfatase